MLKPLPIGIYTFCNIIEGGYLYFDSKQPSVAGWVVETLA